MNISLKKLAIHCLVPALFAAGPCVGAARAQGQHMKDLLAKADAEYRLYFRQPVKTHEFWAYMQFEIAVGKFELAGLFLKQMLEKMPADQVDQDLVKIQQTIGYGPFLDLRKVQKWSDSAAFEKECQGNVKLLLKRLTEAVEKYLSDPERINKFIGRLDAPTPEERDYALAQLLRSRERIVPYVVDHFIREKDTQLRRRILEAYLKFDPDCMAPLLEILKAADPQDALDMNLRPTVLELFRRRGDKRCVPYLWHLSQSQAYPRVVRDQARELLAYLTQADPDRLPQSKMMLSQMAESFYQHKAKIELGGKVLWRWDGQKLPLQPEFIPRRQAEEFFGLRYAREALELDPTYQPAQIVMLNFVLERTYDQDIDKFFSKPMPPEIMKLLTSINTDLLMTVLERGMEENNLAIVLPLIDITGKRGDIRATEPTIGNPSRGLNRALFSSDRRVQFAAITALMRMPYRPVPVTGTRVVDVMRRFAAADTKSRTMFAMVPLLEKQNMRNIAKNAKFDAFEIQSDIRDVMEKLANSADYDVIFIHPKLASKDLPFALTQLRRDIDQARLPLIVLAEEKKRDNWEKLALGYPNTWVVPDTLLLVPEELKKLAEEKIFQAGVAKLTVEERKMFASESMTYLWKMGRGDIKGYDVVGTQDTMREVMFRSEELAPKALDIAARKLDRTTQLWLASVVFDPAHEKLKMQALALLHQHIERIGLQLDETHIANLKDLNAKSVGNPELQTQLALILTSIRIGPRQTGIRLQGASPVPPAGKKDE